jgi:uncharacterized protein (DUF2235 family)
MKRIVLCCDGTWNQADQESNGIPSPSNVVRIAYRLAKQDGATPQVIYYDQGVGTGNLVDRFAGGAFGEGLDTHIYDAYRFMIANYEVGDEIYLFGFSRGAFTARCIGGMIRKCGVLKREAVDRYHEALELYHSDHRPDDPPSVGFRTESSLAGDAPIPIEFIGVWDTVGALGIPVRALNRGKYEFHDTELSKSVKRAAHALAIDEHRGPFEPTLWSYIPKEGQTVEQVWFCGAHSDVGGGYLEHDLSDVALEWMIGRAKAAGLAFDEAAMAPGRLHPNPEGTLHNSRKAFYLIMAGLDRPIGLAAEDPKNPKAARAPDPTQSVHDSVRERWDSIPSYRPPQLLAYFKRSGDPRGG